MTAEIRSFVFLISLFCLAQSVFAKRPAPPDSITIRFGKILFVTSTEKCGLVIQKNAKTGRILREISFYRIFYNPLHEKDAQDVWITDFFRSGDDIWARDEKGRIYRMFLKLLKPERVKYLTPEEFEDMRKAAR